MLLQIECWKCSVPNQNKKNKSENRNPKLEEPKKKYDLEERTEKFSISTRNLCVKLKKDVINTEYIRQLVRSAGSVAAKYIEANENLGPKDLKMKIKISRK